MPGHLKAPHVPDRLSHASTRAQAAAERGRAWADRQEPTSSAGTVLGWVRRYREADGQLYSVLLAAYIFLTVLPVLVVLQSYLYTDPQALANRWIRRLELSGAPASLLRNVLAGTGAGQLGSTLFAIANVLVFGLGFGRVLQLAHARSWGIPARRGPVTDPLRYTSSLLVMLGMLALYMVQLKVLDGQPGWISVVLAPLWVLAVLWYFTWLPRLLLHNRVSVRDVFPGAVLTVIALIGMRIISSFLLVRWLVWYSTYYGSFGVVMALFFWLVIGATILVIAAALSPAVAERRNLRSGAATPTRIDEGMFTRNG